MSSVGEKGKYGPTGRDVDEEVVTCDSCGFQAWMIFSSRMECFNCKREEKLFDNVTSTQVVNLVNDTYYGILEITGEVEV